MKSDPPNMWRHVPYYEAPPGLEQRIRQGLAEESLRQESLSQQTLSQSSGPLSWRWLAIAACMLLAISVAGNLAMYRSRADPQQLLAANVLSAHVRSLVGTHLLDVPSSDQHTVKPWFNGKLDFAPDVKFLEGFPLLGGRLEYFDGRPAAALIFGRDKHIINLFTWPTATPAPERTETRNGYHLESWSDGGMAYWAVSDLNEMELGRFVAMYRAK